MIVKCEVVPQCGYNKNGFCTRSVIGIGPTGVCKYIGKPEWTNSKEPREEMTVITLAKQEN